MSYQEQTRPPKGPGPHNSPSARTTTQPQDSKPKRKLTQRERVSMMLFERPVVCGTEFLEAHLPRYGARIYELRKAGWDISREACTRHPWHESTQYAYRLESLPFDPGGG